MEYDGWFQNKGESMGDNWAPLLNTGVLPWELSSPNSWFCSHFTAILYLRLQFFSFSQYYILLCMLFIVQEKSSAPSRLWKRYPQVSARPCSISEYTRLRSTSIRDCPSWLQPSYSSFRLLWSCEYTLRLGSIGTQIAVDLLSIRLSLCEQTQTLVLTHLAYDLYIGIRYMSYLICHILYEILEY